MWRERLKKYWARQVVESEILNAQFEEPDEHTEVIRKAVRFGGVKVYALAMTHVLINKLRKNSKQ